MSMSDPVADMLTRIRNAQQSRKKNVNINFSKLKYCIAEVLKNEGYINDLLQIEQEGKKQFIIELKYYKDIPVIENISKISKPSLRVYKESKKLPNVVNGLGIAIVSTSKGVMADRKAKELGIGGEVLCIVS
ncbi:MAG TPA: 30S ribosomal protein S8 [Nitrosomonas sp.]|nr:30S ribosomal protein S8 [Nitrosomonas sp.]HMW20440.1 30S ribosomal protein S8 [Nitrosomonas sp.]HMW68126.1 30S ribosomal protein S8 [Nitrosomonas sp.]HMY60922.1 30S ribosomal protein S8 [Nitrosomonas sp.]HMY89864.1 30S ribosomal protein S8 [Nitrosomonas sp.]